MDQHTPTKIPTTIGLDLGARVTQVAVYNTAGNRIEDAEDQHRERLDGAALGSLP